MGRDRSQKKFAGLRAGQWMRLLVLLPGIPFLACSVLLLCYANVSLPVGEDVRMAEVLESTRELIVLVHGKGDTPSSWAEAFAEELRSSRLGPGQQVVTVDWGEYSHDLLRSTLNGRDIGHDLGKRIAAGSGALSRLHLVGHSAGSFVVYGICESVRRRKPGIHIHTTFLAPVTVYRGIDWKYGYRNFGTCADVSDAWIDREDRAIGASAPLRFPHSFDVTALRRASGFNGTPHLWPVAFYRKAVLAGTVPLWEADDAFLAAFPPGHHTLLRPEDVFAGKKAIQ
ncbi:MAG: hypothetical protein Kow0089_08250 [Desulfobulbaceae bacterium]